MKRWLTLAMIFLSPAFAIAQVPKNSLTPQQCQTLKTDIAADPALAAISEGSDRNDQAIANAYNIDALPDYWVFRYDLGKDEIIRTKSVTGTSFTITGTGYIGLTQGERDAFDRITFDKDGKTNCGLPNVVQGFIDIFSGSAANRAHLAAMCRRRASRIEKLFASNIGLPTSCNGGTATGTTGPCVMNFVGPAKNTDIACALNLP